MGTLYNYQSLGVSKETFVIYLKIIFQHSSEVSYDWWLCGDNEVRRVIQPVHHIVVLLRKMERILNSGLGHWSKMSLISYIKIYPGQGEHCR